ncbi:MAG: tail fiber domain-containing protein, partial [Candidatus Shapirobacteria bacterium]
GKTLTTTTLKATNAQDTTLVTNLNADLLDGKHATDFLGVGYTGFEIPLTFNNGLTRTGNNVGLGGNLTQNTTITNNGFNLTTIGAGGTIGLNLSSTGRVSIGTGSTHSIFHISGSGDLGQDLRFDWASNTAAVKPTFMFNRARLNGGVYSAVVDGDNLAMNEISGWTANNAPYTAARWGSNVDGTVSATSVPGNLYFSTTAQGDFGPTERLRITSSGNVGIGTTSPFAKLTIQSDDTYNDYSSPGIRLESNSGYRQTLSINTNLTGTYASIQSMYMGMSMVSRNLLLNPLGGNVGIGTSDPLYQLDVNGQVRISNLPSGSNNYVVTQNGGVLNTRTIDSRVWGSTLSSGTGVLNYSARWLSANTLGTGAIYDNGTRVGIGTTNPTATLEVGGTASVISNSSGNMTISAASNLILQPTGGYVGIGTTSPESLLHINPSAVGTSVGNTMVDIRIKQGASSGNISIFDTILRRHTAGSTWSGTNVRLQRTIDVSPMGFIDFGINGISSDQGLGFGSNNTTNMVIKSDGNVGIGTTGPNYKLHIDETATSNFIQITTANTGKTSNDGLVIGYNESDGAKIINRESTVLQLGTSNKPRLTINANGSVQIGTGYTGGVGGDLGVSRIGRTDASIYFGPSANYIYWYGNRFAKTGTAGWVENSDARIKTETQPLGYGLNEILKLQPKTYNLHNDYSFVNGKVVLNPNSSFDIGLIAQDVYNIIPEIVTKPPDENSSLWTMNYAGLTPILINAVQELNTKIEGLDITSNGSIVVNYNVSPEVLASLGYSGAKNELENGSYSLTDNLGKVVTRVGQFGELAVGKLKAGFISSKAIVTDNLASKNISSETIVTGDLTSTQIGTTQLTALKIGASEASFSTVYADQIINPEGNISDVLATRIGSLRQEIKDLIASNSASESTPSAIAQAATTWETAPATQSADLSGSNLTLTGDLIVGATLTVNGQLTANSAYIADLFTVGQIALKNNILETTADTLYIQPSGLGNINILNNRLVLTADGNIAINGNVTVTGSLTAGLIKAEEIEAKKLTAGKINVATSSAVLGLATTSPDATSSAATAGTITLSTGQTEVIINNSQLTPNSMVYLTPNGSTQNQVPYIKNKNDTNFTIAIDTALDHDVNINWWLIN